MNKFRKIFQAGTSKISRISGLSVDHLVGLIVLSIICFVAVILIDTPEPLQSKKVLESEKVNEANALQKVGNSPQMIEKMEFRVIDGDTLELNGIRYRLVGIDAPEKGQECSNNSSSVDCGQRAMEHLIFLLEGSVLKCVDRGNAGWDRVLGYCTADGVDLSHLMVKHGWAVAYRKYSTEYVSDEEFAKINGLGMWSKEFIAPSNYRKKG